MAHANSNEQKIRDVMVRWQELSKVGDLPRLLPLMAEDVIFLVPGHPPMRGREGFAAAFQGFAGKFNLESNSEIQEIQVTGDLAYCWTHLSVSMTPVSGGETKRRAGYTLTIFRKEPDGNWVLARDANMLTEV